MGSQPELPSPRRRTISGESEIEAYLQERIGRKDSATKWWNDNRERYLKLAKLAGKFLSVPMAQWEFHGQNYTDKYGFFCNILSVEK